MRKNGELDEVNAEVGLMISGIFKFFGESLEPSIGLGLRDNLIKLGYMLTSLDFELFKHYAIDGKYKNRVETIEGKEFAVKFFRLTPDVLIEWLCTYISERCEEFAGSQKKIKNEPITESQLELLKLFASKLPKQTKVEPTIDPDKAEVRDLVISIHNEFKAMQIEQDNRLVEVEGKHYDFNEYLKFRTNGNNTD